jgi:hypothetical protein
MEEESEQLRPRIRLLASPWCVLAQHCSWPAGAMDVFGPPRYSLCIAAVLGSDAVAGCPKLMD